jgi:hypothetical protein
MTNHIDEYVSSGRIYYTVQGDTNTSVAAHSIEEAGELLGVPVSEVEDTGCLVPCGAFDDSDDVDTSAYQNGELD